MDGTLGFAGYGISHQYLFKDIRPDVFAKILACYILL
jgi:hypothetical protein